MPSCSGPRTTCGRTRRRARDGPRSMSSFTTRGPSRCSSAWCTGGRRRCRNLLTAEVPAPSDDGYVLAPEVMAAYEALTSEYSSDPIGKWNRDRDELTAALDEPGAGQVQTRSPWGETDIDSWLAFAFWDPLVHTWDLAESVDQPTIVDAGLCELALVAARAFDAKHDLRRPGVADEERPASRSDALGRLLEFAGRDPGWRASL